MGDLIGDLVGDMVGKADLIRSLRLRSISSMA